VPPKKAMHQLMQCGLIAEQINETSLLLLPAAAAASASFCNCSAIHIHCRVVVTCMPRVGIEHCPIASANKHELLLLLLLLLLLQCELPRGQDHSG
jgi:hypothetical protein